jgi:hypothetical protein
MRIYLDLADNLSMKMSASRFILSTSHESSVGKGFKLVHYF